MKRTDLIIVTVISFIAVIIVFGAEFAVGYYLGCILHISKTHCIEMGLAAIGIVSWFIVIINKIIEKRRSHKKW